MNIVTPATVYTVFTAKGTPVNITFCHKDEQGNFVDGITSEELLKVLVDRHGAFLQKVDTTENLNVWTHLKQALTWMSVRVTNKIKRKHQKVLELKS